MRTLFWRDMLGVGTVINLLASFVALMAASQGVDIRVAAALHFAPLPYNLFLFMVVWRAPKRTLFTSSIAAVWLAVMTVV
ncbi:MAG: hypothetical protein H7Z19_06280 [Chitinophagaceae bacterium]|nr:hypothetical protein [Rubrivivax sp.]